MPGLRTYRELILRDRPIGYWPLDDPGASAAAVDRSGYGRNGTYGASSQEPARLLTGLRNAERSYCSQFLVTDFAHVGALSAWDLTGDMALEGWVRPLDTAAVNMMLSKASGLADLAFYLGWGSGANGFNFAIRDTVGQKNASTGGVTPTVNAKYHVVGTRRGDAIELWLNGALQARTAVVGATQTNTQTLYLSFWQPGGGANYMHADAQDFAIYDHALSPRQILDHFEMGRHGRLLVARNRLAAA